MGIVSRLSYAVRSKVNALVRSTEDPSETLDYSYERLRDKQQEVETGLADLTAQKKRLEVQRERLAQNVENHDDQAREAVRQDRDDLARRALEKKRAKREQIEDIDDQIANLEETQRDLEETKEELQTRIEEFRTKKETMKARHEAAEAQTRVSEAVTGLGDGDDVNRAIERAKDRTEEMEARAAAMDELSDRGVLDGSLGEETDEIERELEAERDQTDVDAELDTLRAEVRGEDQSQVERANKSVREQAAGGADVSGADLEDVDEDAVEAELERIRDDEDG
jgi:phage shock protein A